jgi:hypothetical protein
MNTEKQLISLYGGEVEIEFYPNSHRYSLKGQKDWLISVTTITGIIDKSRFLMPWAVNECVSYVQGELAKREDLHIPKEEVVRLILEGAEQYKIKREVAASIGDKVHEFAEKFTLAQLKQGEMPVITDEMEEKVVQGINAFLEWYNSHNIQFLEAERIIYSREYGYVGKCDGIALVDCKKTILDYKTGKGIYDDFKFQVAGYRIAYEEETKKVLDQSLILHFSKDDGNFTVYPIENKTYELDALAFKGLLLAKKRLKELEKEYYAKQH